MITLEARVADALKESVQKTAQKAVACEDGYLFYFYLLNVLALPNDCLLVALK